ncbi:hypothetical protein AnigIFM63309_010638 [Aspergillus niger]|nr:hypothetical protein AnigIFM63309_010638 [Aspergillus niger]
MFTDIYKTGANVRKVDAWKVYSPSRHSPNIFSAINKDAHGFKRRVLKSAFSDQGLSEIEEKIIGHIRRLTACFCPKNIESLAKESDGWLSPINVAPLCDWFAFDLIGDITYGSSFEMLDSPQKRWVRPVYTKLSHRGAMCLLQPKIYKWKIDQIFFAPTYNDILSAGNWVYSRVKNRAHVGNEVQGKDVFSAMIQAKDPITDQEYNMRDIWSESMALLGAATETTSATMSALFFYVLHDNDALSRVTTEIRGTFNSADEIHTGPKLDSCQFLQACLKETLRLNPGVPLGSPRRVLAGGLIVGGRHIPEAVTVSSSLYTLMRRQEYFEEPDEFHPQRWIVDPESGIDAKSVRMAQQVFCPFGFGATSCIGRRLAWMDISVAFARSVFQYDMRMAPEAPCCAATTTGKTCEFPFKSYTAAVPLQGVIVQFRKRKN